MIIFRRLQLLLALQGLRCLLTIDLGEARDDLFMLLGVIKWIHKELLLYA